MTTHAAKTYTADELDALPKGTKMKCPEVKGKTYTKLPRAGAWFVRNGVYLSTAELVKATNGHLAIIGHHEW